MRINKEELASIIEAAVSSAMRVYKFKGAARFKGAPVARFKGAARFKEVKPRPTGPIDEDTAVAGTKVSYGDGIWHDDDAMPDDLIGLTLNAYLADHPHRVRATRYASESSINLFLELTGLHENDRLQLIDREACQKFKHALMTHSGKRPRKAVTIQGHLHALQHFTRWLQNHDYQGFDKDPMRGLALPARVVSDSKVRKEGFTDLELGKILTALAPSRTAEKPNRVEFYWLSMALVMTGARLSELLLLTTRDVREIDGVWCFDLKREEGKRIKTRQSIRHVPLHSQLREAGFLEFHKQVTTELLFPSLVRSGVPMVSRLFTELLKAEGIKRPALSLHSCRHTLTVLLAKAKVDVSVRHRLLGHAYGTSLEETTYLRSLDFSVQELSQALESVTFPSLPQASSPLPDAV
jgi:integrase